MIELRPAHASELRELSALCLASKAVWGYDDGFLEACRDELTLTGDDLAKTEIVVASEDGVLLGVAQIESKGGTADLIKLFVAPDHMGRGLGRKLMAWCIEIARCRGADILTIEADPDAAPFYARMGAKNAGTAPSGSIPGRMLPRMVLALNTENAA